MVMMAIKACPKAILGDVVWLAAFHKENSPTGNSCYTCQSETHSVREKRAGKILLCSIEVKERKKSITNFKLELKRLGIQKGRLF